MKFTLTLREDTDSLGIVVQHDVDPKLYCSAIVVVPPDVMADIRRKLKAAQMAVNESYENRIQQQMRANRGAYEGGLCLASELPGALSVDDLSPKVPR